MPFFPILATHILITKGTQLTYPKATLEDNFGHRHDQKDATDDRIEPKECDVYPLQAAPAGDPVLEHQAANNNKPPAQVGDAESAQDAKQQQQPAHNQVCQKGALERVLGPPRNHQRMQAVGTVKFVVLQRVNNIEPNQPEDDRHREHQHLDDFQNGNMG